MIKLEKENYILKNVNNKLIDQLNIIDTVNKDLKTNTNQIKDYLEFSSSIDKIKDK